MSLIHPIPPLPSHPHPSLYPFNRPSQSNPPLPVHPTPNGWRSLSPHIQQHSQHVNMNNTVIHVISRVFRPTNYHRRAVNSLAWLVNNRSSNNLPSRYTYVEMSFDKHPNTTNTFQRQAREFRELHAVFPAIRSCLIYASWNLSSANSIMRAGID